MADELPERCCGRCIEWVSIIERCNLPTRVSARYEGHLYFRATESYSDCPAFEAKPQEELTDDAR